MRIILFTGKGGVGKTTISAATGLLCSKLGYKTLVTSVDPAHSLSDCFSRRLDPEPIPISENLYGQETDVQHVLEDNWGAVKDYLTAFFMSQGIQSVEANELAILPGMEELSSLLYVHEYDEKSSFDVMIMDMAPTSNAIRLLSTPDALEWYMEKIFPIGRKTMQIARPVLSRAIPYPLPDEDVYDNVERVYRNMESVRSKLSDYSKTSIRLVLNPERMVINESRRTLTYLNLFNFPVDAVITNKVIEGSGEFLGQWKGIQEKYIDEIEKSFSPIPVLKSYLREGEIIGRKPLEELGSEIYDEKDPTDVFYSKKAMDIEKEGEGYTLTVELPFSSKEDIDLYHKGTELIINIGSYKRSIYLPHILHELEPKLARFEGKKLIIKFS